MKCRHKKFIFWSGLCWCYECGAITRVGVERHPIPDSDGWSYGTETGKPATPERWMVPVGTGGVNPAPAFFAETVTTDVVRIKRGTQETEPTSLVVKEHMNVSK